MSPQTPPATPYKGLMPYTEEDALFFFGREPEREIITANLLASRLTVLYGPSGVGKSSVLRAGVADTLRAESRQSLAERGTPDFVVVAFNSWRDDPIAGLAAQVHASVEQLYGKPVEPPSPASGSLVDLLQAWTERLNADLLIILDQFEEYFLYHAQEDGEGTFAVEFPRAINRRDLQVNFLVALREDALAKLDRFKGRIPNLFDNYLRVEHLDREAARTAIVQPIAQYNKLYLDGAQPYDIEPALVETVLDQIKTGQVILGEAGRGAVVGDDSLAQIETPYLQLVMSRLWEEEQHAGSRTLRLETLDQLGGAERIVRTHLDAAMSGLPPEEQEIAARVFHHLVTPSGTKIAHTLPDLAEYAELPPAQLTPVLEKLAAGDIRILRASASPDLASLPRYEIFHDVLAAAILDWQTRYVQARERAETERELAFERRRVRRLRLGIGGLSLLVIALVALAIYASSLLAITQTSHQAAQTAQAHAEANQQAAQISAQTAVAAQAHAEANQQRAEALQAAAQAQSVFYATQALSLTVSIAPDPEIGLMVAIEAAQRTTEVPKEALVTVLRQAIEDSHLRSVLRSPGQEVVSAAFSSDGTRIVTAGHGAAAELWEWSKIVASPVITLTSATRDFTSVAFSPDGRSVAAAGQDTAVQIWGTSASGEAVRTLHINADPANSVAFSPDGRLLLTAGRSGVARVWDWRTGGPVATLSGHGDAINTVAFSADGKSIVTASKDRTARIWAWDGRTARLAVTLSDHSAEVLSAALSPDGSYVVTVSGDGKARIWNARDGSEVKSLGQSSGGPGAPINAAFSPDGKLIVTANGDGSAQIWEWQTSPARPQTVLSGGGGRMTSVAFSPDGKYVLTGGGNGGARVWAASSDAGELPDSLNDLLSLAKTRVTRGLTEEERRKYFPDVSSPTATP